MDKLIKKYFDFEYYREKYPDIKQHCKTYEDSIWHFCGVRNLNNTNEILNGDGMKEGRLFNKKLEELEKYTTEKYIIDNPFLKNKKKKIDIELHFLDNYDKFKLKEEKLKEEKLKEEKLKQEKLKEKKLKEEKLKEEKLKEEKLIKNNKHFDIEFYKQYNTDLHNLSYSELKTHFITLGKEEGRLFNAKLKEFDKLEYINNYLFKNKEEYNNLYNKSLYEYYLHFLDNYEKFKLNVNIKKVLIIYVYYERQNETKNQTNLSFFIKYGLNNSLWKVNKYDITTLFVINNNQCEVLIPHDEKINVLKQENCTDWEGWYNGIKFIENKYREKIYNKFDYLCLINCSCFGPIFENNINKHWLDPFIDKLNEEKSVICSPCKNLLPEDDLGGPGYRIVPIFSLIKIDKNIINLLINKQIYSFNNNKKDGWYNTVLGKKKDKIDAVLTGEYGLSKILLKNNYKISSLITGNSYSRIDFYNKNNINDLKNTIFIKNVWRWEGNYASQPVLYKYCIDFLNLKMKYKNEFNEYENKIYNFNSIENVNDKMIISYNLPINKGPSTYWNSK